MPPKKLSNSLKMAFAAINAYLLFRAEPQSFDAAKYFKECTEKDDVWHSLMRIALLHYSSEFRPKRVGWEDSDFDTGCRRGCFPTPVEMAKRAKDISLLRQIEPSMKKSN